MADQADQLNAALAGRYAIERTLGSGGMASVYLAHDLKHRRLVAIKVLKPDLAAALGPDRFLREIEIAARLTHPHILPLHDSGEAGGLLYYVMPYVEGESLRERLARERQLPVDDAIRIAREVADALSYAHSHDVVHRDIKPENILLEAGHAVVADFGIARAVSAAGGSGITSTGLAIGTPAYMSPEQASGSSEITGRTDIYSLACVLFEALAGRPLFTGSPDSLVRQHIAADPPTLIEVRPAVGGQIADALNKALAKTPADRFTTAMQFADAFTVVPGTAVSTPPPEQRAPQRSPALRTVRRVAVAVMLLLVLGTGIVLVKEGVLEPGEAYAVDNPRRSLIVLPFSISSDDPSVEWLAEGAPNMLTIDLEGWRDLRVVGRRQVEGFARTRGLALDRSIALEDAIAIARDARVGTLVVGEVLAQAGGLEIVVRLYDVASRDLLRAPDRVSATVGEDLRPRFDSLAARVLDLSGAPAVTPDLRASTTHSLQAYRAYLDGLAAMFGWRLDEAEGRFAAAIQLDSTFALAYHRLGMTKSWNPPWDEDEVRGLFESAVRNADRLPWRQRQHVLAAHAFYTDDFDLARQLYGELIAADSTDGEAWFALADVNFHDPETVRDSSGSIVPRGDINLALVGFLRAVELDPRSHFWYGHAFDIIRQLNRGGYAAFDPPVEDSPDREARDTVEGRVYFYPAWRDSAFWVPIERGRAGDVLDRYRSDSIVDLLRERAMQLARRWANAAPDESRPHLVMRGLHLERKAYRRALEAYQAYLGIEGDTSAVARMRLGALYLANGVFDTSATMLDAGLEEHLDTTGGQNRRAPTFAVNGYIAQGRVTRALELMAPHQPRPNNFWIPDPDGEIPYGDAMPLVWRLEILGSTGAYRPELRAALDSLLDLWSEPRYTPHQTGQLIESNTYEAGRALFLLDDTAVRDWFARADSIPPSWRAYLQVRADSAAAAAGTFDEAVARYRDDDGASPFDLYRLATVAQLLDRHEEAVEFLAQMDTSNYSVMGSVDGDWGLLTLSYLQRARSYEAMAETEAAIRYYERFLEAWSNADEDLQVLADNARDGLARLRRTDR